MLVPADMHTVQLDHRLAVIEADHSLVAEGADGVSRRREGERMTRQIQVILARDEVLEEARARLIVQFEDSVRAAADQAVLARTGFREGQACVPAGKLRGMRATEQRRVTVHVSGVQEAIRRTSGRAVGRAGRTAGTAGRCALAIRPFNDSEHPAVDGRGAERARDGGVAFLGNGVGARATDVDRVMTGGAMLDNGAAIAEGERIVTAADDYFAAASDVDIVVTVSGVYRPLPKNGDVDFPATRNADGGAH
jgi:hypothetical protein